MQIGNAGSTASGASEGSCQLSFSCQLSVSSLVVIIITGSKYDGRDL